MKYVTDGVAYLIIDLLTLFVTLLSPYVNELISSWVNELIRE